MEKTEGQMVREAFDGDGPELGHDALIDQIEARSKEEYERASDSSESAAKTREFLDETGMNSQAFSWCKTIMKKLPKKDGEAKAMDMIRSLKVALPMIEAHVTGQSTPDMFDGGTVADDGADPDAEMDAETASYDDEAEEFDAAADEVFGDSNVTPIDFGGEVSA